MKCSGVHLCLALGISGLCLAALGWVVVPIVVRSKIADELSLRQGTESWDRWENLPVPIQYRVFVYEILNPEEVMKGEIPEVKEVGPYIYNEKRIKTIISVDEEEGRAVYEQKIVFEFDEIASAPLTENDVLMVVNPTAMLFGLIVDSLKSIYPVINLYNTAVKKMWPRHPNPVFIETTVKDLLFEGIPMHCNQTVTMENFDSKILCEAFRLISPKTVNLDDIKKNVHSFSFLRYKNGTSDGIYEIDLGIRDVTQIGQILSWNGVDTLSIWKGESCNKIRGTDTTVFRPYLEEDDIRSLFIYHTDVCRSIELVYDSDTEFKGVKGRRYIPSKDFLASPLKDSENHCFCPQSVKGITHYGGCLRDGGLELSACQGAPVIISTPHFLTAHPSYQDKVKGLSPDVDKHRIFLDLEPNTGYPLRAGSRIQINAFMKGIREVELMANLPNILTPIIWIEEKVELTDELIDVINSRLLNNLQIAEAVKWCLTALGLALSVGSCGFYFLKLRKRNLQSITITRASGFYGVFRSITNEERLCL